MNHERAELIDAIRATARAVFDCSKKMEQHGLSNDIPELWEHGAEMVGAAQILETWAKGLEE